MEKINHKKVSEISKEQAEIQKLQLEAEEIRLRISASWWKGQNLTRYVVAIVITSALLFGWTRAYLEPILRHEYELNKILEMKNEENNKLLAAENISIKQEREDISTERDKLTKERDDLKKRAEQLLVERAILESDRVNLEHVVVGLNSAVVRAENRSGRFFSILNRQDPINDLDEKYGWEGLWSDNYFGHQLGYYLVLQHNDVLSGKKIYVGRIIEIERLKKRRPDDWQESLKEVTDVAPVIALDYSYFGLEIDDKAPVGGTLYKQSGETTRFYAPLELWAEKLSALLTQ